jgi:hypothetical protein
MWLVGGALSHRIFDPLWHYLVVVVGGGRIKNTHVFGVLKGIVILFIPKPRNYHNYYYKPSF